MNSKKISKNILLVILILFFQTSFIFAQTNLELANKYYDSDDYLNAIDYFKKTIFEDKKYNGTIFYRYAYSLEQNGNIENEYAPFYAASAYCFEKENQTEE